MPGWGSPGLLCVALALGHETVGQVWVLPTFSKERLSGTRLGPSSMTEGMVRVTWHIVTIFALAVGGVLLTLAWDEGADPKILLLRWFAVMWLAATAMAAWVTRRHPPLFAAPAGADALGGYRRALLDGIDVSGCHLAVKG